MIIIIIIIIIVIIIIYENYYGRIKIIYGRRQMSKLLTSLNNLFVLFPILATIRRHLFTQMLVLTEFRRSFCRFRETKKMWNCGRYFKGPHFSWKKLFTTWTSIFSCSLWIWEKTFISFGQTFYNLQRP